MTVGPWLRACAERNGDREAIEVMGAAKSYSGLDTDADRLAVGLTAGVGLETGDRAAVIMRNSLACVDTWFAMAREAASWTFRSTWRSEATASTYVLGQSRSQAVVCDIEFADRLAEVTRELPELRHVDPPPSRTVPTPPPRRSDPASTVHELPSLYRDTAPNLPVTGGHRHRRDPVHLRHHRAAQGSDAEPRRQPAR